MRVVFTVLHLKKQLQGTQQDTLNYFPTPTKSLKTLKQCHILGKQTHS